jgi:hypothetical protein
MEVSGQLHTLAALPPEKGHWHPLDRRLSSPQSRSGRGGEEENSHLLPGLEPPIIRPASQRYPELVGCGVLNAPVTSLR